MYAKKLKTIFGQVVNDFKANQIQVAKRSFGRRADSKPNSVVAALIERNNRERFLRTLLPSRGTLLVVPSVLIEHWQVRKKNTTGSFWK